MTEYKTILEIYELCQKLGINCELSNLYDGYKILFPDGADVVQHSGSYGSAEGYVEPAAFDDEIDYTAVDKRVMFLYILNRYE